MSTAQRGTSDKVRLRALTNDDGPEINEPPPELLYKVSMRPGALLKQLWHDKAIIRTITERNLRVRYKQSILGVAWALISPLGLLVVVTIVFKRLAGVSSAGVPYALFAYVGLLAWTFFASTVSGGASSVLGDRALLNKGQFAREVFPLSTLLVACVDCLVAMVPLGILFAINTFAPAATTPLVILPIIVLLIFAAGCGMALAAMTVYVRDIRNLLPLVLQIGLFASPVAYGLDVIPQWARLPVCFINPVAPVIDSIRRTVLLGHAPQWGYLGAGALTSFVVLLIGYTIFKRLEGGFVDVA